jgi:uncharacterized SAM-binding protein YcdF (DUF218 family)
MFLLSKLSTILLLPPGLFIAVCVLSLVFLFLGRMKLSKIVLGAVAALFYLLSIEPVMDGLILGLENRYPPLHGLDPGGVNVIVVLGTGGVVCNSPEEGGAESLSPDYLKRVVYARNLHDLYNLPIIVSGGRVTRNTECDPESRVAKRTLETLGVGNDRIFVEDESRNTWENALYVGRLYRPDRVVLVTSAYHMRRSIYCFKRNGIRCIPAPTDYKSSRSRYNYRSYLPRMVALEGSHLAMKEWLGLAYYRIRYRG